MNQWGRWCFFTLFIILFTFQGLADIRPKIRPDLQVTSLILANSTSCTSCRLSYEFSVRNPGGAVSSFDVDVYFARGVTRSFLKASNRVMRVPVRGLPSGGRNLVLRKHFTIPAGTRNGRYFVIVVADPDKNVTESNENNNKKSQQVTITTSMPRMMATARPKPDLVVESLNLSKTDIYPGETIRVQFGIRNTGDADSSRNAYKIKLKASNNPTSLTLGTLLDDHVGKISKGGISIVERSVTIPKSAPSGRGRSIWVMADSIRRVAEKNENNNIAQTPIDLKRPLCDLKITSIVTVPTRAKIGDRIEIKFKELNRFRGPLGAATSLAGAHYIQVKLEYENTERRNVERVMRNIRVSSLKGEEERELTTHITLPGDMGYIRCFIEVITDSRGQVREHSEDNNSRRIEFMAYYR